LNPALPVLAALALGALLLHRREAGIALAVCGLAAMLLLAPALALPDGIPSPGESLGAVAPWQGILDPERGNPILVDVYAQVYPWLLHLRHELRSGRLPFWNPHQSAGTPYWGNGSSAPLFPLHLLFAALPLQIGFVLLPWLRAVAGGAGAFALARRIGVSREGALLAAVTYALSGMLTSYLLFPMANALALVPWVLWATEGLAAGASGIVPLALLAGLQLLAGHPETAVHTALLSALYLLARGSAVGPLLAWKRFLGGWGLAWALSAIHLLPLAWTLLDSSRWHGERALDSGFPPLSLLVTLPLRLVLPDLHGNPAHGTWWGPFNYVGTAVYAGALALPLAAAGAVGARRDRRMLAVLALLVFSFAAAYQTPGLREALRALPIAGRALHHRLLFGVELGLALLAGAGADRWRLGRGRGVVVGSAVVLAMLAAAWVRFGGEWARRGLEPSALAWTAVAAAVALALVASLRLAPRRRDALALVFLPFAAVDLVWAHGPTNPAQRLPRLYPETGAVEFLRARPERMAGTGWTLRPNAAMVYRLFDVRGDDSVKLRHYEQLYAERLGEGHPTFFTPITRWEDPWLDHLGVRWVMAGPQEPPPVAGWTLVYTGRDAQIFERPSAEPLARWSARQPGGALSVEHRAPGLWEISWSTAQPATVVVAEAWDRGWRASVDGTSVGNERANGHLLAVPVGPGTGRLVLWHRPAGLAPGAALSLAALVTLVLLAVRSRARGQKRSLSPIAQ
jgi:hypothetical protein